jgi:uncharacterized peroxidase-related enzyme
MAFIRTIPPHEATDAVRDMYQRQQAAYGYVPNYAKVFSHRPEVMERWAKLLAAIRRPVDPRRFELITFAAARALRNSYCSLAHGNALTNFLDEDAVRALARDDAGATVTAAEIAMMKFARKVAIDAANISVDDIDVLRQHGYCDDEIFDIVATAAARSFFTKILDSLGAEPDVSYLNMDQTLRQSLTVGRPIARGAVETLPPQDQTIHQSAPIAVS